MISYPFLRQTNFSLRLGFLLFLFGQYALPSFGQSEAANWPMGPVAGVTFRSGAPEKLTVEGVTAIEIAAAISDNHGNLLFYTDGHNVWDKANNLMPNGSGLRGSPYSSRVQICPKPGDPLRYYIFTTDITPGWGVPNDVARFSEVELCSNSGLGEVVVATKNTPLTTVIATRGAVVKHANGIDYWVAFHRWQSNQFYAFQVSANGVNPTPVISAPGSRLSLSSNSTGDGGEMKFSPDGKKLAMAISQFATAEVFDFDAQTGIFSNAIKIPAIYVENTNNSAWMYTDGIEFSPDSRKLYVTRANVTSLLSQYDLTSGDQSEVVNSMVILAGDTHQHANFDFYFIYGLQLGPDGKIYVSWQARDTSGISAILSPNEPGMNANYQHDLFHWENEVISPDHLYSFPTFASSLFNGQPMIQHDFTCSTSSINFWLKFYYAGSLENIDHLQWSFDDPTSGILNVSNVVNPTHAFMTSGVHAVTCTITWKNNTRLTLQQTINIPEEALIENLDILPPTAILCEVLS
jgi:PKD repeat protein